jgi:hypothetical protein
VTSNPSCRVEIDPDNIFFPARFDPWADKSVTVEVLKNKLKEIEAQLTAQRPQTDKALTTLSKKKRILEDAILSFSPTPAIIDESRKLESMGKQLRRKANRFDQQRK